MSDDTVPLLQKKLPGPRISLLHASLCIVDIFGVFPIIALPRTIVQCGLLGIPLVLIVFGLQIYSATLLAKSWGLSATMDPQVFLKNRYPLAAVTELTMGRWASTLVSLLLDLSVFGGGIPNLLVASQNLQLFGLRLSREEFNLSFCYWLLIVGMILCPILWLRTPHQMKCLVTLSIFCVFATAIIIWWAMITDVRDIDLNLLPNTSTWEKFLSGYGMLVYQFDIHPTLMTIQVDMKKPRDINKAVVHSFIISGFLFAVTAGLAVWRYEGNITANVLEILPPTTAVQAAILIAAVQLILSCATGNAALFEHLEDQLRVRRSFDWKRCAMRSAVVFLAVAVGESVPRFDIVMSLVGGSLIGPLVFILPPLLYSRARALRSMGLRRSSAPEFLCVGPDRRTVRSHEIFSDPRVHSRSTHYGFRYGEEDKNDGYSFTYYDYCDEDDDDFELNLYTDNENSFDDDDDGSSSIRVSDTLSRSGSLPVMVDASRPSIRRSRPRRFGARGSRSHRKPKKFFTKQRLLDWFSYCVMILGIFLTISSTIVNWNQTMRFVQLTPPCIINATAYLPFSLN